MPDIAFQMRDMRRVSGIVSGSDLIFSGAIYRIRIAKNDHLYQFTIYFKYKWHLIEMPDNAYRMQDVRWVSGIFSGIDLMYAGAISVPEMQ